MIRFVSSFAVLVLVATAACTEGGSNAATNATASTVSCRQKADSDTDSDCKNKAGKPRKLDCDSDADTQSAIAAGCERTDPDDNDVCCATTVTGKTTSGSTTTVSCRQKADSDTDSDCEGKAGKPRKLDCDSESATTEALAAGCERTDRDDSDVCCPVTVGGQTGSTSTPDGGSSSGSCSTSYVGTWSLTGTCPETSCEVTQDGCALEISCGNGTTLAGTISGSSANVTGSAGGQSLTCSISFSGKSTFSLSCGICNGAGTKS